MFGRIKLADKLPDTDTRPELYLCPSRSRHCRLHPRPPRPLDLPRQPAQPLGQVRPRLEIPLGIAPARQEPRDLGGDLAESGRRRRHCVRRHAEKAQEGPEADFRYFGPSALSCAGGLSSASIAAAICARRAPAPGEKPVRIISATILAHLDEAVAQRRAGFGLGHDGVSPSCGTHVTTLSQGPSGSKEEIWWSHPTMMNIPQAAVSWLWICTFLP